MTASDRADLQALLVKALGELFDEAAGEITLPLFGHSTLHHMANAVINIVEVIEDVENYIGDRLSDEERENIGI